MYFGRMSSVLLLLLASNSAVGAVTRVYSSDEIEAMLSPARVESLQQQLVPTKAKSGNWPLTLLKALVSEQASDPVSEFLLREAVLDLDASTPPASTVKIIEKLATRENQVFVLLDEGGHASVPVPAFDVAAAARFKLAQWAESDTYVNFSNTLARGEFSLANYSALTLDQRRGVKRALGQADPAQLEHSRAELVAALAAGLPVADLAADAALQLSDKTLFNLALEKDTTGGLHKQLSVVPTRFTAADGLEILKTATRNTWLRSVALLQIPNLDASAKPAAIEFLMEKLRDESSTGSAAAALASFADASLNDALGNLLNSKDEVARRGAALALYFEGGPQSTALLRDFIDSPSGDLNLKRDVAKWFID